ncbi:MAG: TlpA family protein disulfide reductase [Algicola sp.]|nr:TlpA family protein disulfide reductase [Algicola sp.]
MSVVVNTDDITNSKVEGTEANTALHLYNEKTGELASKRFEIGRQLRSVNANDDTANSENLDSEMATLTKKMEDFPFEFVKENNDNPFSVILLQKLAETKDADYARIESALNSLSDEQQKSITATMLKTQLQIKKAEAAAVGATQIGQVAPSFSAPNPYGDMVSLNDVKGKLTLIDFWASWCKPCRRENPNVVKVYNKYHSKGLEIISVSLDGSRNQKDPKAAWIKAIEDDNLTWSHVSNLNYFNDPVARAYNIRSIPATFLLDENGKIVAKNLRGDALENKVAEYLN